MHPPTRPGTLARIGATILAAASVAAGKTMIALRLRRAPEGWRRTVGILLRSEATRFALSAFGLRVQDTSDAGISRRLLSFLAGEPEAHFALEWRASVTIRHPIPVVDVVLLRFGADGRLASIDSFLAADGAAAPAPDVQAAVHEAIVAAYNRTANLPELARTRRLMNDVRDAVAPGSRAYARRLLSASCLSFERIDCSDPARRFAPPNFVSRRTLGLGYLSWVARPDERSGTVDLWVSAHHVGLDGVPLQDLLNRLERAWGTVEPVVFPPAGRGEVFVPPQPCHAPGERPVDHLTMFVDMSPVFTLRRHLNERHAGDIGGEVTFGALVAWLLAQEPEFAGLRIASTVDVKASGGYERDVDVVPLRPADFATGSGPWDGLVEFAREFNRLIAASRTRTSPLRAGMQTAGLLPAWAHATAVRSNPASLDETFGSLCVTIVRDARVFVAPMTDLGLGHGFFAIGRGTLPSADGRCVTSVSIKGDAGRIGHYPAIFQRMLDRCAALHPTRKS